MSFLSTFISDPTTLILLTLIPITLATLSSPPSAAKSTKKDAKVSSSPLQLWKYLLPYYLASLADWLRGPYTYQVYAAAGYRTQQISLLFVTGFLSSMVFGTFFGSIADRLGRKKIIIWGYIVCYSVASLCVHFPQNYSVLLLGRILSGVATSVLMSAFESWMIADFGMQGNVNMDVVFYWQILGNGTMAILAGLLAHVGMTFTDGRYTSAFDLSLVCLVLSLLPISLLWKENYGNQKQTLSAGFSQAFTTIFTNRIILCIGIAQSLFEAAMFIFVYLWSPTLDAALNGASFSHALVFSCFMVCVMLGSNVFSRGRTAQIATEKLLVLTMSTALIALAIPIYFTSFYIILASFLLFEACVGLFWPTIGTLKGKFVPDETRSTVMNFFRLPTNFFVIFTVLYSSELSVASLFVICCSLLAVAMISSLIIKREIALGAAKSKKE